MFEADLYPPEWRRWRQTRLAQAEHCCEACGVPDRTVLHSQRTGKAYMVYLSIAHCEQYQTWRRDAETMVLCQGCHRRYDRQFVRKKSLPSFRPIGFVEVLVERDGRRVLAGEAKNYHELQGIVAAMPAGTLFWCVCYLHTAIVGNGTYHKVAFNQFTVESEHGPCVGLVSQFSTVFLPPSQ